MEKEKLSRYFQIFWCIVFWVVQIFWMPTTLNMKRTIYFIVVCILFVSIYLGIPKIMQEDVTPLRIRNVRLITIIIGICLIVSLFIGTIQIMDLNRTLVLLGFTVFFIVMGYMLPKIPPNHVIGIRTPWVMNNAVVWKKTHTLMGRISFPIALLFAIVSSSFDIMNVLIGAVVAWAFIPFFYSLYIANKY